MPLSSRLKSLVARLLWKGRNVLPSSSESRAISEYPPVVSRSDAPGCISDIRGYFPTGDEQPFSSMSAEELSAWENRDVPTLGRLSDVFEAAADERQDVTTSLNFPLHWTSPRETWDYLFDFAIACELLGPRPDDLVLDFAAGTCWATEFLNRVGVRTVSIDLSLEMMQRGRRRLQTDSRLVFRDHARFVVARGQALPFANETFDGVLCLNALHHQPIYSVALQEIYRILKPGGRAVFSEPGTTHGAQPLSEFRMREENILEKSVSLPFVHRLAADAGFSRMRVVPLRSTSAYVLDYSATPEDASSLTKMWDETLQLSAREHARFVLDKGDTPALDTHLPAHCLVGRLSAHIVPADDALVTRVGEPFTQRMRITNTGSVTWKAQGRRFGGQVTCGLKLCDLKGNVLREDLGRRGLPFDVVPGREFEIEVVVSETLPIGRYGLRYDMVVEGVTWFEFQGSRCAHASLEVIA